MEIIVEDFWCLMGLGQIKNNEPYFHFWHVTSIISNKIIISSHIHYVKKFIQPNVIKMLLSLASSSLE